MTTMASIVEVADLMLLPWVPGGRLVNGELPIGGIDCWGTVVEVRRRAGLWTPDPWGCGPQPVEEHPHGLPESFMRHLLEIPEPVPYCVVRIRSPWPGGHAGVYLPDGTVLHTQRNVNTVRVPYARITRRVLTLFDIGEAPE